MAMTLDGTYGITAATWNTSNRPTNPAVGEFGYNTTNNQYEGWNGTAWATFGTGSAFYTANVVVVGGGGGGGGFVGGGGGAGGFVAANLVSIAYGATYSIVVGAGGTGATNSQSTLPANTGSISSFYNFTAFGGGGGGTYNQNASWAGGLGGSGGGNGQQNNAAVYGSYGRGIPGQGYDGGYLTSSTALCGGGGAGGFGANGASTAAGGVGRINPIPGSTAGQLVSGAYYLAGGGGAGSSTSSAGGNGGGGATGVAGTANTGGGGGGANNSTGANGGSGVVIIAVPTANYPGNANVSGTYIYTVSGTNTILQFNSNGSYTA
jgi:hypothetical protein